MPIYDDVPRRDYEEALRSLGRVFDEQQLKDLLLVERESGFLVTGLRASKLRVTGDGPPARYEYAEHTYDDSEVANASAHGITHRGSGEEAQRNEKALRLIGRRVNEADGARVVVIDHSGDFMVRMLLEADAETPNRFTTSSIEHLELMAEASRAARREDETASR